MKLIIDHNQKIEVIWSNRIKSYYEAKGYRYTGHLDHFYVNVSDLPDGSHTKVKFICDECGKCFISQYVSHVEKKKNGKRDLCKSCAAKLGHKNLSARKNPDSYSKLKGVCENLGYMLITTQNNYKGTNSQIDFLCPKHGIQNMLAYNLINGHKCIVCSYDERGRNCANNTSYVEQYINSINGNKLLNKDEYVNSKKRNLKVLCGECSKNIFIISFNDYYSHKTTRCKSCASKESSGEKIISEFLINNGISFEREKRFAGCKDINTLPFDFYLNDYNLLIEFDGPCHYKPVYGTKALESHIKHDKIKDKYCIDNCIDLLRIPYFEGNNIDNILKEKLQIA